MAQIAEIIKNEGDDGIFIWKRPLEDFNRLTQRMVHESQEAIKMMNSIWFMKTANGLCLQKSYPQK